MFSHNLLNGDPIVILQNGRRTAVFVRYEKIW